MGRKQEQVSLFLSLSPSETDLLIFPLASPFFPLPLLSHLLAREHNLAWIILDWSDTKTHHQKVQLG